MSTQLSSAATLSSKRSPHVPQGAAIVRHVGPVFCFSIHALAEPGVMPRVLELFAKRNLVPDRWHSDLGGPDGRELSIDLQISGLGTQDADYIARCLRGLAYVEAVLTSEKRFE